MFPLGDPPTTARPETSLRARRESRDPREVIYDYLTEGEGNFIFSPRQLHAPTTSTAVAR
jgi:hypothetical protein